MPKQYFKIIPAVYLLLKKNNQILLMQRANTGYQDGMYSLPAGHLDGDETLATAMAREAWEEIGIKLDSNDLSIVHVQHRRSSEQDLSNERIDFYFTYEDNSAEPSNMEPLKCSELRWVNLDQIPDNTITHLKMALNEIASDTRVTYVGW